MLLAATIFLLICLQAREKEKKLIVTMREIAFKRINVDACYLLLNICEPYAF
jgi:hypothetical protein